MMRTLISSLSLLAVLGGGAGCALTSKSSALPVRYFTPEAAGTRGRVVPATGPGGQLRLGQVNAASYIRDKIVYRTTAHELGFHERWRWTEDAEAYVKRALARSLFQDHGLHQTVSGPGLTLEVDLDTFEDRRGARRAAHVELTWRLRDEKVVLVQRTVTVQRPIGHPNAVTGEDVAVALAGSLAEALDRIVVDVLAEMATVAAVADPVPVPP